MPEHRALVARFLHFYPQYELADLRQGGRLTYGEFMFLTAGMFDIENPEATEAPTARVGRLAREMAQRHADAAKKGRGHRRGL